MMKDEEETIVSDEESTTTVVLRVSSPRRSRGRLRIYESRTIPVDTIPASVNLRRLFVVPASSKGFPRARTARMRRAV